MNNFIKKLGAFSIGPIVGALFSFITVPATTYFITPEEYGKSSMFILAQALISLALYLGLDQAFVKEYHLYKDKDRLIQNALFFPFVMVVVLDLIIYLNKEWVSHFLFGDSHEIYGVVALMVLLPFMIIENFSLLRIRMEEKGVMYSAFVILVKFLILVFTISLIMWYEKSFRSVIYAIALAQIIDGTVLFIILSRKVHFKRHFLDKELIKRMFRFGLPLIPATVIGLVLNSMDKIMLREMSSFHELGIYAAAFKIVSLLGILQQCFTLFWTPMAFRWFAEKKKSHQFALVGKAVAFVMVGFCLGILLFKDVIVLILGPSYNEAIYILPFLLLYPIMYTISEVTALGIPFTGKTEYNIIVSIIAAVINIGLNFTLIPIWGGLGAAIATGVSYIGFFWSRTLISKKLWMKEPVKIYALYTALLVLNCGIHSFIKGVPVYVVTGLSLIFIIVINIPEIKKGKVMIKELQEDTEKELVEE